MRILVTTSVLPRWRGDATPPFVLNLCKDLAAAGMELTLLAPHSNGAALKETVEGLSIRRYRYFWPPSRQTLCYDGGMIVRRRSAPLRMIQLPFLCLSQHLAIQRELTRHPYDLLHAHSLLPQGGVAALANERHLPLVMSSHGADVHLLGALWQPALAAAARSADLLIANSEATRARLLQLGAPPSRVLRIPATPNFPDPEKPSHRPPDTPTLLFAGRLIHEKGPDLLLEALPSLRKTVPGCRLRFAGSGNLETALKQRSSELGLEAAVDFLGWCSPGDLRTHMQSASLLVAPSRMIEGQNLVVTEALSIGCPVATTPRGGVLDLIRHEQTGLVLNSVAPAAMAAEIAAALNDRQSLDDYSRAGFSWFVEQFSRHRITHLTRSAFERLLR
jgi:glycosyltransferase involved in cell wall biosynthesis